MIAIFNRTRKTLTIRRYNLFGRVVLKEYTLPLPKGRYRDLAQKYIGGAAMPLEDYKLLENNNLIIKNDGEC